jgi:hypothetical protein
MHINDELKHLIFSNRGNRYTNVRGRESTNDVTVIVRCERRVRRELLSCADGWDIKVECCQLIYTKILDEPT